MHSPLLNVIHRLPCLAMVDYHGISRKKKQTMSYLFWRAIRDWYQLNEALEILRHRANTIPARPCFLLPVSFHRMIL